MFRCRCLAELVVGLLVDSARGIALAECRSVRLQVETFPKRYEHPTIIVSELLAIRKSDEFITSMFFSFPINDKATYTLTIFSFLTVFETLWDDSSVLSGKIR